MTVGLFSDKLNHETTMDGNQGLDDHLCLFKPKEKKKTAIYLKVITKFHCSSDCKSVGVRLYQVRFRLIGSRWLWMEVRTPTVVFFFFVPNESSWSLPEHKLIIMCRDANIFSFHVASNMEAERLADFIPASCFLQKGLDLTYRNPEKNISL